MIEVLKHFSLSIAVEKNKSFRFFIEHYVIANPSDAGLPEGSGENSAGKEPDAGNELPGSDGGMMRSP